MKTFTQIKELTKQYRDCHWRKVVTNYNNPTAKYIGVIQTIKEVFPDISIQEAVYRLKNNIETAPVCLNCDKPAEFRTNHWFEYRKYCSTKCQHEHNKPAEGSILLDGTIYESITLAIKLLGINRRDIVRRIYDSNDNRAQWANIHDQTCIEKLSRTHKILGDKTLLQQETGSIRDISTKFGIDRDQIAFAKLFHQI